LIDSNYPYKVDWTFICWVATLVKLNAGHDGRPARKPETVRLDQWRAEGGADGPGHPHWGASKGSFKEKFSLTNVGI